MMAIKKTYIVNCFVEVWVGAIKLILWLLAFYDIRAVSRFSTSQWETSLLCNDVSHWLGENLESALWHAIYLLGQTTVFMGFKLAQSQPREVGYVGKYKPGLPPPQPTVSSRWAWENGRHHWDIVAPWISVTYQ